MKTGQKTGVKASRPAWIERPAWGFSPAAIAYERGDFGELEALPPTLTPLSDMYADAVAWATEASGGLAA